MSEPQYSYLCTDLTTNKVLGELFPISGGVSFDRQFNQAGNCSINVAMDDSASPNEAVIGNTHPGKTSIWVYRESKVVWGGILWTRAYDASTQQLALTGQTFDSYAAKRYPRSWLGNSSHSYSWGQCWIINNLWTQMQGVTHGSIGVEPQASSLFPQNDVVRQLTISGTDFTNTVDAVIGSLTQLSTGPDYTIEFYEDGYGLPRKRLRVGNGIGKYVTTINIGGSSGKPSLVSDYPEGSVSSYTYTETASTGANTWWVVGGNTKATKTTKSVTVIAKAANSYSLDHGFPLMENSYSQGKAIGSEYLQDVGESKLKQSPIPQVTHATDLIGSELPEFSTYDLGDWWEVNITDARFPSGINFVKRVIGWSVTPPDTGGGPETISVVYDEPQVTG